MIIKLLAISAPIGLWYYYKDTIWNYAVRALAKQAKVIIKSELEKETLVDLCSRNLNSVIFTYVLENPLVIRKTADLFKILFETERFKNLSYSLSELALQQQPVRDVIQGSLLRKSMVITRDEYLRRETSTILHQEISK
jgi:hypothetical protein